MVAYVPKRGDVVWLHFDPQKGKEIQKRRPALTISPKEYNKKTGLGLFMPVTSQIKGYPFEVILESKKVFGAILCDQLRSLDWKERNAIFIVAVPDGVLDSAMAKLHVLLD